VPRLRRSPLAGGFLDGVNVASLALMIAVTWTLARGAIVDATTAALGLVAAVLLVRHEVNATWLVVAGAACGVALAALGLGPG
jgi:chromate transporter